MLKKSFFVILIILVCLYLLPMEALFLILIAILFYEIVINHKNLRSYLFPGISIYIYFLFAGLFIGICHIFFQSYAARDILKHIVYVLFPLLFWMVGKNINFGKEEWEVRVTALFAAGVLVSLYDLFTSLFKILTSMISGMSLYEFRKMIGTGHPLTMITLFLYIFLSESITFKKKQAYYCIALLSVDLFLHFSRINLLNLLIFLLFSGNMKKPVKFIQYCILIIAGLTVFYIIFPSVFENYVDRFMNTLTEISYSNFKENWDHVSIVTNWRGYEAYCEIQKFQSVSVFEKVMGGGFGARLDVYGKAYLVTTEKTLPFLHNGYFTVLMIWGILGCAFFIVMLVLLYAGNVRLRGREQGFWKALVVVMALDTMVVHGPFFSTSAASLFLYLSILDSKNIKKIEGYI